MAKRIVFSKKAYADIDRIVEFRRANFRQQARLESVDYEALAGRSDCDLITSRKGLDPSELSFCHLTHVHGGPSARQNLPIEAAEIMTSENRFA